MVAAGGLVVLRDGADASDPVILFGKDGQSIVVADSRNFAELGRMPGISDDGSIVVFYGNLKPSSLGISDTFGPGIFASIDPGGPPGTPRKIVRVAGNPAELGYDEGSNAIQMSGFDMDSRVGVSRLNLGLFNYSFVVCFMGIPSLAIVANPATGGPLLFSANRGIWTVRVDVEPNPLNLSDPDSFRPRSPLPVVQLSDKLPLGSGQGVIDLSIYDPIANAAADQAGVRTQRRGDHYVAFWAATPAGQFVVRGAHLDSDQDGLLDHWETEGIDIDQDGKPDLDLFAMGPLLTHGTSSSRLTGSRIRSAWLTRRIPTITSTSCSLRPLISSSICFPTLRLWLDMITDAVPMEIHHGTSRPGSPFTWMVGLLRATCFSERAVVAIHSERRGT